MNLWIAFTLYQNSEGADEIYTENPSEAFLIDSDTTCISARMQRLHRKLDIDLSADATWRSAEGDAVHEELPS